MLEIILQCQSQETDHPLLNNSQTNLPANRERSDPFPSVLKRYFNTTECLAGTMIAKNIGNNQGNLTHQLPSQTKQPLLKTAEIILRSLTSNTRETTLNPNFTGDDGFELKL
jgi:hypothetical protein